MKNRLLSFFLVVVLALSITCAEAAEDVILPREQTLTFNGLVWGAASSFNPLEAGGNPGFAIGLGRFLVYESLYMYNMMTGQNEPYLAASEPELSDDGMQLVVELKHNVTFNDGVALTAQDVVFSYEIHNTEKYPGILTNNGDVFTYIAEVEARGDHTIIFTLREDNYNPLMAQSIMAVTLILPEHVWAPRWQAEGPGITTVYNEDTIGTGPYRLYIADDARQVMIRNDNYWGQAENMFGKLPAPKYLMHELFQDNNAGNIAFGEGRVDVSQQFLPSVWEYKEKMKDENGKSLVNTYYEEAPYQLGWGMPSLVFNLNRPGLSDYTVRKALALSLDYEAIATNAMSGYTSEMVMCFYNVNLFGEYIDMDDEELRDLMWDTTDLDNNIALANAMLDEAGYLDVDGDGMREMPDGSKIEWKAQAPAGWSDWNASLETLAEGAKKIGLNVVTHFPEMASYFNDYYYGTFDIGMWAITPAPSVAMPWQAAFAQLYSKGVAPIGAYSSRNTNRYKNDQIDELIELSMTETDQEILTEYYSEINKIWLNELPTVPLMYRPQWWQTTYGYYWTNFAKGGGESDIPPLVCMDGAGIRELFMLVPTGRK